MEENQIMNEEMSENETAAECELCKFEFDINIKEEEEAFIAFQKKYVYKKNVIKSIGFALLAGVNGISLYRDPSKSIYIYLMVLCIAIIFSTWYNVRHVRKSLMQALKILEDDKYIFTLFDDSFKIETVISEEEKQSEDFQEIKPVIMKINDPLTDIIENDDKFIIIVRKTTIYVLPKRCMNKESINIVRKKLINE